MSISKVAFIGLGVMGYHMAGHLSKNGYSVAVHNRSNTKAIKWGSEFEGVVADSPNEAAQQADVVILCVGNDSDVENVLYGTNGISSTLSEGTIVIDHTTASATLAKKINNDFRSKGIGFLDAPVSGGGIGSQNGTLSIMVGGEAESFEKALPLMKCYGASINLMGNSGSGQLTKMVNQILIGGALKGVAEAISFGKKAGLNMNKVLDVVSKGAAQSWQLENRGPWMLTEKYKGGGFTVNLYKKDLDLLIKEAGSINAKLPSTTTLCTDFAKLQQNGKGDWDFSCIFEMLDE